MEEETEFRGGVNPWIDLSCFCWNLAYEHLSKNTQLPLLGLNRGLSLKLMQAFDAWAKLYPTSIAYQGVITQIQIQSLEELIRALLSIVEQGETVKDWSQLQQLWSYTADRAFEKAFNSEDNLKVRGSFLNAVNQYKLCQQELVEVWMNLMNLPTRSEVDEVHKNIYELRREVKRLKKSLALSQGQAPLPVQNSLIQQGMEQQPISIGRK